MRDERFLAVMTALLIVASGCAGQSASAPNEIPFTAGAYPVEAAAACVCVLGDFLALACACLAHALPRRSWGFVCVRIFSPTAPTLDARARLVYALGGPRWRRRCHRSGHVRACARAHTHTRDVC